MVRCSLLKKVEVVRGDQKVVPEVVPAVVERDDGDAVVVRRSSLHQTCPAFHSCTKDRQPRQRESRSSPDRHRRRASQLAHSAQGC